MLKKLQHNRAKKLCFMVSKCPIKWHCAKSVVDTVRFLFCHTSYFFKTDFLIVACDTENEPLLAFVELYFNRNKCISWVLENWMLLLEKKVEILEMARNFSMVDLRCDELVNF